MLTDSVVAMTNAAASTKIDINSGGTIASLPVRVRRHLGMWCAAQWLIG